MPEYRTFQHPDIPEWTKMLTLEPVWHRNKVIQSGNGIFRYRTERPDAYCRCPQHWPRCQGTAMVSVTPVATLPAGVVDTSGAPWLANISVNFRKKFELSLMLFSRSWGKMIHEKNIKHKILWHCPFKSLSFPSILPLIHVSSYLFFIPEQREREKEESIVPTKQEEKRRGRGSRKRKRKR